MSQLASRLQPQRLSALARHLPSSSKPIPLGALCGASERARRLGLLLGLGAALGCRGGGGASERARATPSGTASATASSMAAPPTSLPPLVAPARAGLTLAERLSHEAKQRPPSGLRPEAVKDALAQAGVALEGWQQVLGSTVGASFCMAGHTTQGLGVALCEYPDAATASRGLAYSRDTFDRLIPHRQLSLRRSTLLTLTLATAPSPDGAHARDEARRISTTFASL